MLPLPRFRLLEPRTIDEAVRNRADAGDGASYVAGGTDLYPNMKRRQQTPHTVISLGKIPELEQITGTPQTGLTIGAVVAILFAPKSGQATREQLAQTTNEGKDYLKQRGPEIP